MTCTNAYYDGMYYWAHTMIHICWHTNTVSLAETHHCTNIRLQCEVVSRGIGWNIEVFHPGLIILGIFQKLVPKNVTFNLLIFPLLHLHRLIVDGLNSNLLADPPKLLICTLYFIHFTSSIIDHTWFELKFVLWSPTALNLYFSGTGLSLSWSTTRACWTYLLRWRDWTAFEQI